MKNSILRLLACSVVFAGSLSHTQAQGTSIQDKLVGKWTQHYTGMSLQGAILNIISVDPTTGLLRGKWTPPSGAAGGKEFDVIGWVSSAQPREKLDNVITISLSVSLTSATGQLKGKYSPPAGVAAGKEFDVIGWVSSAPPVANRDNVVVISFSVSLNTYGSIATWTGFLKENKIIASSSNARSNTGYEWDHITATYDVWTKNP